METHSQEDGFLCDPTDDHQYTHEYEMRPVVVKIRPISVLIVYCRSRKHIKLNALSDDQHVHVNLITHEMINLPFLGSHHSLQLLLVRI